ncbi:MAG TPA: hypothetical protein VIN08_21245 [Ohtaekwangia sp.]
MKKFLVRVFLLLGIHLTGFSQLHAEKQGDYIHDSSAVLPGAPAQAIFDAEQRSLALMIRSASSDRKKEVFTIDVTEIREEEDDESISFKKRLESSSYIVSILFAQTHGYFFSYTKKVLPFNNDFSSTSSNRYLILQVIRI